MASALFNCRPKSVATSLLVIFIVGCGPKAPFPLAPVRGSVSYQGKPVRLGRVVFVPSKGTPGPQAVGQIQPDGSFQMRTGDHDGAAIGQRRSSH